MNSKRKAKSIEDCYAVIHPTAFIIFKASQVFMYIRGQRGSCLHISPAPLRNVGRCFFSCFHSFFLQTELCGSEVLGLLRKTSLGIFLEH